LACLPRAKLKKINQGLSFKTERKKRMIKVKEYQGLRIRHEVNLDIYQGKEAFALLDEKESFARDQEKRWEGSDWRLFITRKNNHLIIRFLCRVVNITFSTGKHKEYCDRWITKQIDHYQIIE